ncbi:MAG: 2-dehydro-3-deoxygalactonokinase [Phycisphaerales bacterium]|nr:2-dehydro-3-deoxygalactonokinase [Hyphomonadaceae bacterium]
MRPYLAVDWGTTNLRAWRVGADGVVQDERELPLGVSQIGECEAASVFAEHVRPALHGEDLPALMCGMIGSNLGWRVMPYLDCPADKAALAVHLGDVGERVRIAPGLRCAGITGAPDVMRGEETQLIGWIEMAPDRGRGRHIVCHPGTHAKWALIVDGRIEQFVTAMTGELFDVLSTHSVLGADEGEDDAKAFDAGVEAAGDGSALATRLFSTRARVVGGDAPASSSRSYLSGLLIGAEIAALAPHFGAAPESQIALLGAPALCAHYNRALAHRGFHSTVDDGADAALAGFNALVALGALDAS